MIPKRIYISGPYTLGDVAMNVKAAIDVGDRLLNRGHTPYIPHLTHFWHLIHPHVKEDWMYLDIEWVKQCDVMLRLPGESSGADKEVEVANKNNIPVFHNYHKLLEYLEKPLGEDV